MSRFLFVIPPLVGHANPARSIAAALIERGHEVAWTGSEMSLRPILGLEAVIYKTGTRIHRAQADQGLASVKSLWERFVVPFTRFTLAAVDKAVSDYRPDVIVSDQATPAGALIAHRHGLRWATLACSTMELDRPYRALPKVERWLGDQLALLWTEAGLAEEEYLDVRFSPHLVLALITAELSGGYPVPASAGPVRLVGPTVGGRGDDPDFPWSWLDPAREQVLISVGTLAAELADDFYRRAVEAVAPLGDRLQAIVVADPATLGELPEHVLALPKVPQLRLLPRMAAVLSHGGLNTVNEALAEGVPLVVAPIRHDQPINAGLVVRAGAGVRVRFARASPAELRTALLTVLQDGSYRAGAARQRAAIAAAGGAAAAALQLEQLALQGVRQLLGSVPSS